MIINEKKREIQMKLNGFIFVHMYVYVHIVHSTPSHIPFDH